MKSKIIDKAIKACDISNEEKDKNFRGFYKNLRKVAEGGTLEELVALRKEMNQVNKNGGFKKQDYSILLKNDQEAERKVMNRFGK